MRRVAIAISLLLGQLVAPAWAQWTDEAQKCAETPDPNQAFELCTRAIQSGALSGAGLAVTYHCPQQCPDLVAKLRAVVLRYDTQVILAPYPGMDPRIALTAWSRIDTLDQFDEKRIVRFIEAYRGIDHHPRGGLF